MKLRRLLSLSKHKSQLSITIQIQKVWVTMKAWMYILRCADNSYYTGSTTDLTIRLYQHQEGIGAKYTQKRLPVELVYCEEYASIKQAFEREKQVQGWSRRKKEALIDGKFELLPELSKS